jgi:hypothetical protein
MQINDDDVVWRPIPNSSQEIAIDSRADHTLYYGTRGPGKSSTQLMYFRQYVGIGYGSFWNGIIFDRHYKNFKDLIVQSKRFFSKFGDCKFVGGTAEVKWVWETGEELLFRHIKSVDEYENFHGFESPFLGHNELTKQPTGELYDRLMSINRSSFTPKRDTPKNSKGEYLTHDKKPLPPIPLKVFSTCNPSGPGRNWVKRRFIDCCPVGTVFKKEIEVFDPQKQKDVIVTKTQIAIFGSYKENIYLSPGYIAELHELTQNDPHLRKAWLEGSWDGTSGGIIDDLWNAKIHKIDRFKIPKSWYVDRCFDWGSSSPFGVLWVAESNGEEVIREDGTKFFAQKGSLIVIQEWYGGDDFTTNKGLKMSAKDIALGILSREEDLIKQGWIESIPEPGPADNQISNVREVDVETIKKKMEDMGVFWTTSDKSQGSRANGLQLMRDMLQSSITGEGAGLYFMSNCYNCLETIPYIPRDEKNPDDADTESNDHLYDAVRYRILHGANRIAETVPVSYGY